MRHHNSNIPHYNKMNQIKPGTNILFNALFGILGISCVLPFLFVIMISVSSKSSLAAHGYTIFPSGFTMGAYAYAFSNGSELLNSYLITIVITVLGVALGIFINLTYAYSMTIRTYKLRKFLLVFIMIPMFFNGGLVATYLVVVRMLYLKNNILSMVLPGLAGTFYIVVLRTFILSSIPYEISESAKIDGASHYRILATMVFPLCIPAIATIGLFISFTKWNEWYSALLYIDKENLYPLQYWLMRIQRQLDLIRQMSKMGYSQVVADIEKQLPVDTLRMAVVVLATLPIVCAYPFFQRYFVSGLTMGSIKG